MAMVKFGVVFQGGAVLARPIVVMCMGAIDFEFHLTSPDIQPRDFRRTNPSRILKGVHYYQRECEFLR